MEVLTGIVRIHAEDRGRLRHELPEGRSHPHATGARGLKALSIAMLARKNIIHSDADRPARRSPSPRAHVSACHIRNHRFYLASAAGHRNQCRAGGRNDDLRGRLFLCRFLNGAWRIKVYDRPDDTARERSVKINDGIGPGRGSVEDDRREETATRNNSPVSWMCQSATFPIRPQRQGRKLRVGPAPVQSW